jgi:hypothetical protein
MPSRRESEGPPAFVAILEDQSCHARTGVLLVFRSVPRRVRWGRVPGSKLSYYDLAPSFEDLNAGIESKPRNWRLCLRPKTALDFEPNMILASIEVAGFGWDGQRVVFRRWWESQDGPVSGVHNPPMACAWECGKAEDFLSREVPALARQLFHADSSAEWPALQAWVADSGSGPLVEKFRDAYPIETARRFC